MLLARAGDVLDVEILAGRFGELLRDETRGNRSNGAAWREADDDFYGSLRPSLRGSSLRGRGGGGRSLRGGGEARREQAERQNQISFHVMSPAIRTSK